MKAVAALGPGTYELGLVSPGLGLGASGKNRKAQLVTATRFSVRRLAESSTPCSRDSAAGSMPVDPDLENWQIRVLQRCHASNLRQCGGRADMV